MRIIRLNCLLIGLLAVQITCPQPLWAASKKAASHQLVVFSKILHIDRQYFSMNGPISEDKADFSQGQNPELLWITGFKAEILDPQTKKPMPWEYFCHVNLQFNTASPDFKKRDPALGQWTREDFKLVSLVQGKTEVKLPDGFGIPIYSNEDMISYSMVINPNPDPKAKSFNIQAKATYTYVKDSELTTPMKPLFRKAVALRVPLDKAQQKKLKNVECRCDTEIDMKSAHPVLETPGNISKRDGWVSSYHWLVPPGRHRYTYLWGKGLNAPYDTTVHYLGIHLHPYGTYIELRDVTAGKTIFKGHSKNFKDQEAVAAIDHLESKKGIPFYRSHEYAIICEYNNTTKKDINAMAMVYLYYLNKK